MIPSKNNKSKLDYLESSIRYSSFESNQVRFFEELCEVLREQQREIESLKLTVEELERTK